MFEVIYAMLLSASKFSRVMSILFFIVSIIAVVFYAIAQMDLAEAKAKGDAKKIDSLFEIFNAFKKIVMYSVIGFVISIPLALVPSPKDLWEIRLELIKFNAISEENINKFAKEGMPVIERLAKKIECRYLGCENKIKEEKPSN